MRSLSHSLEIENLLIGDQCKHEDETLYKADDKIIEFLTPYNSNSIGNKYNQNLNIETPISKQIRRMPKKLKLYFLKASLSLVFRETSLI